MKILEPFYYRKFKCIGGSCPDTCCADWIISIDEETWKKYEKMEGELGKKIRKSVNPQNGLHFELVEKKCPLLNKENLCEIVLHEGEENLCGICREYPRKTKLIGDTIERSLNLSCPEVARIMFSSNEVIGFYLEENDVKVDPEPKETSWLVDNLLIARDISIDIVQNRDIDIWQRLIVLQIFNRNLHNSEKTEWEKLFCQNKNINYIQELADGLEKINISREEQFKNLVDMSKWIWKSSSWLEKYCQVCMKYINDEKAMEKYTELLCEYENYYHEYMYIYEHFAVYYLFQFYMENLEGKTFYKRVTVLVLTCAIMKFWGMYQWLDNGKKLTVEEQSIMFSKYARLFEHNPKAHEELYDALKEQNLDGVSYMLLLCRS